MPQFLKHILLLFVASIAFAPVANSQRLGGDDIDYLKPKEYTIGPIRVEGAEGYDETAIKFISGLQEGKTISVPGEDISAAIKKLWEQSRFSDVKIYADKIIGETIFLVIQVKGRSRISKYSLPDIPKKDADKIRESLDLYQGKIITESLIKNTEYHVREYYDSKGFLDAEINVSVKNDTSKLNNSVIVIDIVRNEKIHIDEINFIGLTAVKKNKLYKAMKETKRQRWWRIFGNSLFSESEYENDKKVALAKLKDKGYRDAYIVKDSIYRVGPKHMNIDIYLDEGEKYKFGDITWIGNSKYSSGMLDTILGIKKGDTYNEALLNERLTGSMDGRDVSSLYMDRGYLFFNVTPVETGVKDHHINYEMRMTEGKQARVKTITIKGNTKTNDKVILREIRTKPGDLFNRNDIIRTQRELAQLGYFDPEGFQVNPKPNPQDGTVDIEYTVVEKSSDQIELSGGWGGGRLIGTLGLTFNNFSLRNMFKKGAWKPLPAGDGQRLSIRAQTNGRFFQAYNFSFTEPWLGGKKPNSLTFALSHSLSTNGFEPESPEFWRFSITGASLGLGIKLKWPDDWFSAYVEASYQYYTVKNYPYFVFKDGYSNNIAATFVLQRNSVSEPIYPREGSTVKLSAKVTFPYSLVDGVDDYSELSLQDRNKYAEYYKIKFTANWYLPLTRDKKLVLNARVGFGFMGSYSRSKGISPFERFYMGGSGFTGYQIDGREIISLRGYEDQSVTQNEGAPLIAKYTLELRYPISLNPSATIYVLGFVEAGNTWNSWKEFNPFKVKKSTGIGVRVFLPMFGLLGVDYGFGFDELDPGAAGAGAVNSEIVNKGFFGKFHFTLGMNLGDL